jgi:hypothetical protein
MLDYIQNLLPRLKGYSDTLDHLEIFVDKPWILIDEDENRHTYVFRRNGSLIMSLNGQAQVGQWEYIKAARSLLIDRIKDKILLKHAFFDAGIMVLRKDGSIQFPWILVNEEIVPDLDVVRYMRDVFIKNLKLKPFSYCGKTYYYSDPSDVGLNANTEFYDSDFSKSQESFFTSQGSKGFEVNRGVVKRNYTVSVHKTDRGMITVRSYLAFISVGDLVYLDKLQATDGVYMILDNSEYESIEVRDGKILKLSTRRNRLYLFVMLILFVIFAVTFIIIINHT